jgi:hypothetical protein
MNEDTIQLLKNYTPGFFMGLSRGFMSHMFEIKKINSQLQYKGEYKMLKNLHLTITKSIVERTTQFGIYNQYKDKGGEFYSSIITSLITVPYTLMLLKHNFNVNKVNLKITTKTGVLLAVTTKSFIGSSIFLNSYDYAVKNKINEYVISMCSTSVILCITYPVDTIVNRYLSDKISTLKFKNIYSGIKYPLIKSYLNTVIGLYVYKKLSSYMNDINDCEV